MKESFISVIVPVYNTEKYLDECIQSVLNQSFANFELLLIDDGSTDRSGEICDQYAAKDERVRVFHKENGGVSSARNLGLDEAKGEWIMFIDADDYWYRDDCLEMLLKIAVQADVDIVRGEYKAVDENGNFVFSRSVSKKRMLYVGRPINTLEFLKYAVNDEFFSWLLLFRRELVSKLRFEVGRIYLEDMTFISEIMVKRNVRCIYVPDIRYYAYRKSPTSASSLISLRMLGDSFQMCKFFSQYACLAEKKQLKRYFGERSVMIYYRTLRVLSMCYYYNRNKIIEDLGLNEIQKITCRIMWQFGIFNTAFLVIILSPLKGMLWFRFKIQLKERIRKCIGIKYRK